MTSKTLFRERVVEQFAEAAAFPVTLVVAPAGYGKSVAISQYEPRAGATVLRFDVGTAEGSLHGFVRGFARALGAAFPDARTTVADAIAASRASPDAVAALASWLGSYFAGFSGVVIVDEFHRADADAACGTLLASLVEATKSRIRWIVASRTRRNLPIGSWLVYGQSGLPIDEDVLRFTRDEARAAASSFDSALSQRDVDRLWESTGGWPTALELSLALAERSNDLREAIVAARSHSFDYLALHVYWSLTDREREILAVGALLPDFDVATLERAGFKDAALVLGELQRSVTFLSPAWDTSGTPSARRYRCDELFRDFLHHLLEQEPQREATYRRAALALQAGGWDAEALALFVRAQRWDDVLQVLSSGGFALIESGQDEPVDAALGALAATPYARHGLIVGLHGMLEYAAGRYERARGFFERALSSLGAEASELAAVVTAKLATVLVDLGVDPSELLQRSCFDASLAPALRGELMSLLVVGRAHFGPLDGLDTLIVEVEELVRGVDDEPARARILHALGSAAVLAGEGKRATRLLTSAAELATTCGMFRLASEVYTNLASSAVAEEDFPSGLAASVRALELAVKSGQPNLVRYALSRQIDIEVHRGDARRLEVLLQAYAKLPGPEHARLAYVALCAQAMLAAWRGAFAEAARLQERLCIASSYQEEHVVAHACCAVFLVLAGEEDKAAEHVRASLTESTQRSSLRPAFYRERAVARSLCAIAEALAGRAAAASRIVRDEAVTELSPQARALRDAAALVVRDVELGLAAAEVAEHVGAHLEVMTQGWYGGYARLIESILGHRDEMQGDGIALTPTELGILERLSAGETPKEIALEVGLSINTIRWYIRQAIEKFGCSGQEQALRAARARGLLKGPPA